MGSLFPDMSDELCFTNAFIGFCKPMGRTWPSPFVSLSYEVVGIEKEINTVLAGTARQVVPELICASPISNHLFCLEAKSNSISRNQADKYLAVTNSQLAVSGVLPQGMKTPTMTTDIIYVAFSLNAPILSAKMSQFGLKIPVISGDQSKFVLQSGSINQSSFQRIFSTGVVISPSDTWPRHFVRFSSKASSAELAPFVVSNLMSFVMGSADFTSTDVASNAVGHWQVIGTQERNAFLNQIHSFIDRAQRENLGPYFEPVGARRKVISDKRQGWHPIGSRPMNTNSQIAMQRDADAFVERQRTGTPFKKQQPPLTGFS